MISIIVPVFNVERVLHFCIDSVLKQSYYDYELILVDDGSTDSSGVICDDYAKKDSRIRVFHQKNCGVSKARNIGIENASGEFICFIDSDDYVDSSYIEKLVKIKKRYPEFDNIWCGFQTVDGYDNAHILQKVVFSADEDVSFSGCKHIMDLHEKWLDAGTVCKLYRRDIILDNNLRFEESLSIGEDLIFNFDYLDCTNQRIVILNQCLYHYTMVRNDTLGSKYYENMFAIYQRINKAMYDYLVKWDCDSNQLVKYYNACFYKNEVVLRNTYHKKSNIKHKGRYNKQIMKSEEFIEALNRSTCFIHPLYRFAYRKKLNGLFRLLDIITGVST